MDEQADMTGDDPIAAAVEGLRDQVDEVSGDRLVHRVRGFIDVRRRRRRRRARVIVVAGATAVVLVAVVVALRPDGSSTQVTQVFNNPPPLKAFAYVKPGTVRVTPSTGLTDDQHVDVSAFGFDFGTTVRFVECVPADTAPQVIYSKATDPKPKWVCRAPNNPDETTDETAPVRQLTDTPNDPAGGDGPLRATASIPVAPFGLGFSRWIDESGKVSTHPQYPGEDPPMPECGSATRWGSFDGRRVARATTCVVVAIGTMKGELRMFYSAPLRFIHRTEVPAPSTVTPPQGTSSIHTNVCTESPDRASLRVAQSAGTRLEREIASKSITGAAATQLLHQLCVTASTAPQPATQDLTACPLGGPDIATATVTFSKTSHPIASIDEAVAGCPYWGSSELGQIFALGEQLPAYRSGIATIGDAFSVDLTGLLKDQPASTGPTTTATR